MSCFVILHYLVYDETIKCVNSILKNVYGEFKIIIVDNFSPNDSFSILESYFEGESRVIIIQNDENNGYSSGINFGYDYGKRIFNPDFIIAMNNDMEITQKTFLQQIENIYKDTHFFVLGPDIYSTSAFKHQNPEKNRVLTIADIDKQIKFIHNQQKHQVRLQLKGFIRKSKLFRKLYYRVKHLIYGNLYVSKEMEGATLHGSCLIFSKPFIIKRKNALTPITSFYCEAQILDYECKRDKMKQVYSPDLVVLHHEDIATNAVEGGYANKMNKKFKRLDKSLKAFKKLVLSDAFKNNVGT